jgi:hypothetical protein
MPASKKVSPNGPISLQSQRATDALAAVLASDLFPVALLQTGSVIYA